MKLPIYLLLLTATLQAFTQDLARFTVLAGGTGRLDCPVSVSLEHIDHNQDQGSLLLVETRAGEEIPVPCQLEPGHVARLWFILAGETPAGTSRSFILRRNVIPDSSSPVQLSPVRLHKQQGSLIMSREERPVLEYQFRTVYPPEGIDPLFKRSGFIHPLWSPGGEELTRIQPPDHYHHYGIWGPWTVTHIEGREVDFWNLGKGEGTVNFSHFISEVEGAVYSGFKALQEHIDFGAKGSDRVAINEVLDVRVWNTPDRHAWIIDYTKLFNTPLDSGILLDAYRYGGGIGFRATERWNRENSTVLTSDKKDRPAADGTRARWCMVEGESDTEAGRSGILFMDHPSNREHPEPIRVWPPDTNEGRGDLFFEFCPIRDTAWTLEKGKEYTLRYRLLVFDGGITTEEAERYWNDFASPPWVDVVVF